MGTGILEWVGKGGKLGYIYTWENICSAYPKALPLYHHVTDTNNEYSRF